MALLPCTSKHPHRSRRGPVPQPGSSLQTQDIPEHFPGTLELPVWQSSPPPWPPALVLLLEELPLHFQRSSGERCCCCISIPFPSRALFSPVFTQRPLIFASSLCLYSSYPQRINHHLPGMCSASNHLTGSKVRSSSLAVGGGNSKILLRFVFHWLEVRLRLILGTG